MEEITGKIETMGGEGIKNTASKIKASIYDIIDFEKIILPYLQEKWNIKFEFSRFFWAETDIDFIKNHQVKEAYWKLDKFVTKVVKNVDLNECINIDEDRK